MIFNQLTLRGIYGREMYETWYKMTVLLESGLDISGVITHRLGYRDFEAGFAGDGVWRVGEGDSGLARVRPPSPLYLSGSMYLAQWR